MVVQDAVRVVCARVLNVDARTAALVYITVVKTLLCLAKTCLLLVLFCRRLREDECHCRLQSAAVGKEAELLEILLRCRLPRRHLLLLQQYPSKHGKSWSRCNCKKGLMFELTDR